MTAAHFSPSADISLLEAEQYEQEAFQPIQHTADKLGITLRKIFRVTDNVERELLGMAKRSHFDIVLVGSSRELFTDHKISGKVGALIHQTNSIVGVFIDKGFKKINNALFVVTTSHDLFLLEYAKKFLEVNDKNHVTVWNMESLFTKDEDLEQLMGKGFLPQTTFLAAAEERKDVARNYDIVVVSFNFWMSLKRKQSSWLGQMPSALIIDHA